MIQTDPKGVTQAHLGPIWYHSEPSDVPSSSNQFLGWNFFCCFLQQDSSSIYDIDFIPIVTHTYILYMTCSNPAATYMFIFYQEIRAIYVVST